MNWDRVAEEYLAVAEEVFGALREPIERVAREIAESLKGGGKLMICGNGGSAADAQHFAAELVNKFLKERRPYAAVALSTDASVLTAIANDYSYDDVFVKQVRAIGRCGDILMGISTSGNARNVLRAVESAQHMNIMTVGLTGGKGGHLAGAANLVLRVSSTSSTPRIQEGHQLVIHALCERIEELMDAE